MTYQQLILVLVFFPLVGAFLNGFLFRKGSVGTVCAISTLAVFSSFLCSLYLFYSQSLNSTKSLTVSLFDWISFSSSSSGFHFVVPFALTLDHLSILFLLIISGIGSLIHLYSGEYMNHEPRPYRFFVYLNLFIFSMFLLVLGSNMLVTFVGWEGVGVCSYLLIGYWYEDRGNCMAAIKAFVVNRIGDAGFLLAMFLCYALFKSVTYTEIADIIKNSPDVFLSFHSVVFTLIGFCLLLAVAGKSAQIPLYTWLPDAMAGPTPVSALIHAATMVTAGIYLMTRTSFLLVTSPVVMTTIAIIGAATALLSATIGLAQTDIKKVLAYSTCSQLGYMVMSCGVGAFSFGVAHVMTHAFFKACLFLGAGSVIHALHHEQDIRKMGGLWKKMPVTSSTFLLATFAIMGIPGFSGFFSKDAILSAALHGPFGHPLFWLVGVVTASLTAFYMTRLLVLVFFGKCRLENPSHVHENNLMITLPLILLAILSVVGGVIVLPEVFTGHEDVITNFLSPVLTQAQDYVSSHQLHPKQEYFRNIGELSLMGISTLVVLFSAFLSFTIYKNGITGAERFANFFGSAYRLIRDKWRVDELYQFTVVSSLEKLSVFFELVVNGKFIDGIVKGIPVALYAGTSLASDSHSGLIRNYIKIFFVGLVLVGCLIYLSLT